MEQENPSWVVLLFFVNDLLYLDESKAWGMVKPYFKQVGGVVDFSALQYNITKEEMEELTTGSKRSGMEVQGCCTPDFSDRVVARTRKTHSFFPRWGAIASELQRQIAPTLPTATYHYQIPDLDFYAESEIYAEKWNLLFQFLTRIKEAGQQQRW